MQSHSKQLSAAGFRIGPRCEKAISGNGPLSRDAPRACHENVAYLAKEGPHQWDEEKADANSVASCLVYLNCCPRRPIRNLF